MSGSSIKFTRRLRFASYSGQLVSSVEGTHRWRAGRTEWQNLSGMAIKTGTGKSNP
jgi:hypothetical protein